MTGTLKRRTLLAGIGALSIGGMALGGARSARALAGSWQPREPSAVWRDMVRLMMSTKSEEVPWWYTGRIYAQVGEQEPLHLFNLEGTEIYWTRELADGSFAISSRTLTFFRDKDTGEMIREFANPFTGKANKVTPNILGGKENTVFSSRGWGYKSIAEKGGDLEPWMIEWHRSGDLAWLTSSRFSRTIKPLMEAMSIFCDPEAVLDPAVASVPAHFTSTYLSPWQGWLDMEGQAGHLVWHSTGKKLASIDEVPAEYLQRVAKEYGDVLSANPASWD